MPYPVECNDTRGIVWYKHSSSEFADMIGCLARNISAILGSVLKSEDIGGNSMRRLIAAAVISSAVMVSGCQSAGPKESWGTLIAAAAGGLVGSQIGSGTGQAAAIGLGVLLGDLAGQDVGRTLDQADLAYAN